MNLIQKNISFKWYAVEYELDRGLETQSCQPMTINVLFVVFPLSAHYIYISIEEQEQIIIYSESG
jgi:hypothetical protein